jgi:hypothetical protein
MQEEFLKHPSVFMATDLERMCKIMAIFMNKNWLKSGY